MLAGDVSQIGYFDAVGSTTVQLADVAGISAHPSGRLYLADSTSQSGSSIFEVSPSGDQMYRQVDRGNGAATGITFNALDGYFYVTDNAGLGLVTRFDSNLNEPRFQFSPQDDVPGATDLEGITSDPATGFLYVADGSDGGRQVLVYSLDLSDSNEATREVSLEGVFSVADEMDSVEGIAFHAPSGHLFLVDATQDRIFEYTTAGTLLEEYDISGFSPSPSSSQGLTFAASSSEDDHADALSLYIADGGSEGAADGRVYEAAIGISDADATSITFRAMADVPNDAAQQLALENELANIGPDDKFFIHLGDIHSPGHCFPSSYANMEDTLHSSSIPVFVIPGDNEWNDCADPDLAWSRWESHLMGLEDHWSHGITVMRQSVRKENFAFVRAGVLFIGINLVGGTVHDADEWSQRMTDNTNWVNENLELYGDQVTSATLFAHAFADPTGGDRQQFALDFVDAARDFGKPILYMQGDKHIFLLDRPYADAPNVTRLVVDQRPSVRISISDHPTSPFRVTNPILNPPNNSAPVLAAIGNKSADQGLELRFNAWAFDADLPGDHLTFSLDAGAPAGAAIDPVTGQFHWTPTGSQDAGDYPITIRVSDNGSPNEDDFETFTVTVNGSDNQPPELQAISAQSVDEQNLLALSVSASDPDSDNLTFSLGAGAPSGATIDASTGEFNWTPGEADGPGVYSITVRVTDDGFPAFDDVETFSVTVGEVNQPPELAEIGNQNVQEGSTLTFTVSATDADLPAANLSFRLDPGAPTGATIDPNTGEFTWTPDESVGPAVVTVTVRVTDQGTPALSDFETIDITVAEVNQPPVLAVIGDRNVKEGNLITLNASATDPDLPGNPLTFSLDAGAPAGATIDSATGEFNWIPEEVAGPGVYSVTVRVTDNATPQRYDVQTFDITVMEVNQPPEISFIGDQSIDEGNQLAFTVLATDSDVPENGLSFSLDVGAPDGAAIDSETGEFTWTPTEAAGPGVYTVTVRATDDAALSMDDFETFTITVGEVNEAPVLANIGNVFVDEGRLLTFTATATDSDLPANSLIFSLDPDAPPGATIDPVTGEFRWTPPDGTAPADFFLNVRVTDSATPSLDDFQTIGITVYDPLDVNRDRKVSVLDALAIINQIERNLQQNEAAPGDENTPEFHYDANDDGRVSALDALLVINHLKDEIHEAEFIADQVMPPIERVASVDEDLLDDDLIQMLTDDQLAVDL